MLWVFAAYPVAAQTPNCADLTKDQEKLAKDLFSSLHPYAGCDQTFEKCLEVKSPSSLVLRLASDICRQIKSGKKRPEIERNLFNRAQTMLPFGQPAVFTHDPAMRAGAADAPLTIVVFACARCPFCKVIVPALYKAVTEGPLRGKACLDFKPFPIKSHPNSLEGGLALVGAAKLNRFWPYALEQYRLFDAFCPRLFPDWAEKAGMDRAAFSREYADPKSRDVLVASKQEGLRAHVKATPTLFINGREYVCEMSEAAILDVLEEACESLPSDIRKE